MIYPERLKIKLFISCRIYLTSYHISSVTTKTPNIAMHIVGSQSKRTAVWNARRDAASLLKEESRTFANATAKIQNSRSFQKRKDKTELFNHNVLSQAEKGHRWTKDYCHVPSNVTTRPDSAVPWAGVQNTKHYMPWAAICKAH